MNKNDLTPQNIEFSHKINGQEYTIVAEYFDFLPTTSNLWQASCREDILGERWIDDVVVYDMNGNDVTEHVVVPDELIWFEIDIIRMMEE